MKQRAHPDRKFWKGLTLALTAVAAFYAGAALFALYVLWIIG